MEFSTRKKMVVMGILFLFAGATLLPGIFADITEPSQSGIREIIQKPQNGPNDEYKITCRICTTTGPILTRSQILGDKKTYDSLQDMMKKVVWATSNYSRDTKQWLSTLDQRTDTLLAQLEDIGLIKNELDKQMVKNQILGGHDDTLANLWEQFGQDNETVNNSLCIIAGYGTEQTRMDFPVRNPFLLSITRVIIQILEFILRYDLALASQIVNYLSTDHILNLALYSIFNVNETRAQQPPWVGVFTYGQNEYQEVKGNCEATIIGYAGLLLEFYVGIGNVFGIDSMGMVGFAGYTTMLPGV